MEDQHGLESGPSISDHLRIHGTAVDRGQLLLESIHLSGVRQRPRPASPPDQEATGADGGEMIGAGTDPQATSEERIASIQSQDGTQATGLHSQLIKRAPVPPTAYNGRPSLIHSLAGALRQPDSAGPHRRDRDARPDSDTARERRHTSAYFCGTTEASCSSRVASSAAAAAGTAANGTASECSACLDGASSSGGTGR